MLAEACRKRKWSVDPRNSTWTNNEKRFGVKMLKKMGWEKGKGLGINEDGNVSHVKVDHKADNKGLGCNSSHEKSWITHQNEFTSLLNQLNKDQDYVDPKSLVSESGLNNLEKQSKSQKILHYKKFSKSKNLSLYKQDDISAIFGTQKMFSTMNYVVAEKESTNTIPRTTANETKNTKDLDEIDDLFVNSKYSVHEYFKMRHDKMCLNISKPMEISTDRSVDEKHVGTCKPNKTKKLKKNKKKKKL